MQSSAVAMAKRLLSYSAASQASQPFLSALSQPSVQRVSAFSIPTQHQAASFASAAVDNTSATSPSSSPPSPAPSRPPGLIEIREYTLKPEGMAPYLALCKQYADVRKELLPFLGMFTCDLGGPLNRVTHFYHYKDLDERDAKRGKAGQDDRWKKFIADGRIHVQAQESKLMLESVPVYDALGLAPTANFMSCGSGGNKAIYELRNYQLHPGYGSVPKLLDAFRKGLPDKVKADTHGQLVFFGHTDVGMLNNVVELWRYPSAQACINARQAARVVPAWRETIGAVTPGVQHFTSSFMKPTNFSPWH